MNEIKEAAMIFFFFFFTRNLTLRKTMTYLPEMNESGEVWCVMVVGAGDWISNHVVILLRDFKMLYIEYFSTI